MINKKSLILIIIFVFISTHSAFAVFDSSDSALKKPLQISRITPDGKDVPAGRKIVFQFNQPVVPLGRMDRKQDEIPIVITPSCNCAWRWINTSALACQLGNKDQLKMSTKYQITVKPGIETRDGNTIKKIVNHTFITARAKVSYAWFKTWKSPGTPVIRVVFNQPVSKNSVENHIFILSAIGKKRYTLKAEPDTRKQKKQKTAKAYNVWLVSPLGELPLDSSMELRIEPGLISVHGKKKGITRRVIVKFDTYPEFRFIGVKSRTNNNSDVLINNFKDYESKEFIDPFNQVSLVFSAPVIKEEIKDNIEFAPDLAGNRKDYDPWENVYSYSRLNSPHKRGRQYAIFLPGNLKAWQEYHVVSKGKGPKDEFGRLLPESIDIKFFTDHRKPELRLIHNRSVLEKTIDSEVPVYVTNLENLNVNYRKLTSKGSQKNLNHKVDIPAAPDIAYAVPLGVRGMLDGKSGAVYGNISAVSTLGSKLSNHEFFGQVTPFQVHVKLGHFNCLVWITDLHSGKIVSDAEVTIYKDSLSSLSSLKKILGATSSDKNGLAILPGTKILDPELNTLEWCNQPFACKRLFVHIQKGDDIAVLPLSGHFSLDTSQSSNYTIYNDQKTKYGHIHSWGTTAQGVYRAGDTIQYKIYVRDQDNNSFISAPDNAYKLQIFDPKGKVVHKKDKIKLSEFGSFNGEFTTLKTGAVGFYNFQLSADYTKLTWQPMKVLVSDFTPSPFHVENKLNSDLFHQGEKVEATCSALLHSGGPYIDAPFRITARLQNRYFVPKHHEAKKFNFDTYQKNQTHKIFQKKGMLDDKGKHSSWFTLPDKGVLYGKLTVESSVQDDRGKYIASTVSADYVGRDRFVGLRNTKWIYQEDKPARIEFMVVDEKGYPVKGTDVSIQIKHEVTKASRVKGAGNAYLTQYTSKWVNIETKVYKAKKDPVSWTFTPADPGSYRIKASIKDTKGREHSTRIHAWVAGVGRVVWQQPQDNTLQIIPEQEAYNIGDKARYLVKNPFPGATALITIERYGVIKSWTQKLETSTPVIEFDIEPDYVPGFYFSVVITSPRVEKPLGDNNIDLGKPAFRMGYVEVAVKDPYKEIIVKARSDKETYKPGNIVKIDFNAQPRHLNLNHQGKKEPIELAVVVLDQAVFDLLAKGRDYYDPFKGFYHLDGLDLENYNLLTCLIGRQRFETKGANTGGGGGADISMRSLFKFVSYWNPSLKTDDKGNASIEFKVPDNLTGWRVFAMAVTPTDRMGLGDIGFKVNQPTEIRPVMPNQLTEGDSFKAGFSIMNRSDKLRRLSIEINVSGQVDYTNTNNKKPNLIHKEQIELLPYKRSTVWMPVKTRGSGKLVFKVTARDKIDGDGLIHTIPVKKQRSLETAANYGTTTRDRITESILFPEKIHTDVGSVSVAASPTVIGNVKGAFEYVRKYPYSCWEQKLTKGVMASHYQNLKKYMPKHFSWEKSDLLPQTTLGDAAGFQAPNGGMAYFTPENQYVSPYLSAYTALSFNWLRDSGYTIPEQVEKKLHKYLGTLLKQDVFPTFFSRGMSSTVRAVALAALSEHEKISLSDLRRYEPHVPFMSLFGKTHYLMAALNIKGGASIAKRVAKKILAHSSQTGGKFLFNEELDDGYKRILATPIRANAAILSAFTKLGEKEYGAEIAGDIPFKLVRSITQTRGSRAHWENTQENMFCMNALIQYSRVYEKQTPDMIVRTLMDAKLLGKTQFKAFQDKPVTFQRQINKHDPGKETKITIERKGKGRLYYSTRVNYAPLEEYAARTNAGMEIRREYSVERDNKWILLKSPMKISRGELVRIDIFLSLPAVGNFVVVDDPVPGGLEPVNRDLATASTVDAEKGDYTASGGSWWFSFPDWFSYNTSRWSFYHQELRHDSVRFYSDFLAAGNYHLSYTAQAIAQGSFAQMPVHAQEMYDPDVYGKGIFGTLMVDDDN